MSMTTRQRNLKALIAQWGGAQALAVKLGYANSSYISHMVTGHRPIGEKTARKIEKTLTLSVGWMDREHATANSKAPSAVKIDASLFARVVVLVSATLSETGNDLTVEKFEEVVGFIYKEATRTGNVDDALVQRVLKLAL